MYKHQAITDITFGETHCHIAITHPHFYSHTDKFVGSVKRAVLVNTIFLSALESSDNAPCHSLDHVDPVGGASMLQICHDYPVCSMVARIIAT